MACLMTNRVFLARLAGGTRTAPLALLRYRGCEFASKLTCAKVSRFNFRATLSVWSAVLTVGISGQMHLLKGSACPANVANKPYI